MRTMKISAMAPTLSRFSTAESCPTTRWRAMAYSSTSRLLPGLCLASILMNSMPITMSKLRSRKVRISASLPSNSRPGIQRIRGTTLSSRPISTSPDNNTSSRLEA